MSHTPINARRRPDLHAIETRHRHDAAVVVKDPVGLKYVQLRIDEFFVLAMLDGKVTLEQIRDAYERKFAPSRVTLPELNQLLFRFHRNGLTIADASLQGDQLELRRRDEKKQRIKQHLSSLLFIRFPGVDPEPLLRRLHPIIRPLLSKTGFAFASLLCLIALATLTSHWATLQSEFPRMSHWLRLESLLILAGVITATKVCHELGHAVVCKHFGGECHCIGPMLLVFTPALYCDTSDSWMLPNRFHRAAVGLAGIGTEILLAAMATIVWSLTAEGTTHYIAMNVMLVCSVSTLLFNANPLLRYDGYYVLSDLCNVPNLGQRAQELLAWYAKRCFFGMDEPISHTMTGAARFWMLSYAVASAAYRWALTLLILWFVSLMLRPYRLESVGLIVCGAAATGMIIAALRAPWSLAKNPARRGKIQMKRLAISSLVIFGLAGLSLVPIPHRIAAEGRVVPRDETPIVIKTAGRLDRLESKLGSTVVAEQVIARLSNPDIELQFLQAKGRYESQKMLVNAIRNTQLQQPAAGNELPGAESLLAEYEKQYQNRKSQKESLIVRAPVAGRLIAAPQRSEPGFNETDEAYQLVRWTGDPTDEKNMGCFLEAGSELMSVNSDDSWDAELILPQSEVSDVTVGSQVTVSLDTLPSKVIQGVVTSIDTNRWTAEHNSHRHDDPSTARRDQPRLTSYIVRVELEDSDLPLKSGARTIALVESSPKSIATRISRVLNQLFRFR